ncbi:MAG: Rha family transcriptional regulator [Candidatus Phlomobacter fragariae]
MADYFGKLHKNIIQKIETLECSIEFASANFSARVEKIKGGAVIHDSKYYEMTKDGFVFLVMGFTDKKANQFKEAPTLLNSIVWKQRYILHQNTNRKRMKNSATKIPKTSPVSWHS